LHGPAAAIEDFAVQESSRGRYENVSGVQGIGVGRGIEIAAIGRQADGEIAVIERVVGLRAEL
jgi:hypothetical protein